MDLKKGDVVVWCEQKGEKVDFFVVLENQHIPEYEGRMYYSARHLAGYSVRHGNYFEEDTWSFSRKATRDEIDFFARWLDDNNKKFNFNTGER
jgi:hypothetical protein